MASSSSSSSSPARVSFRVVFLLLILLVGFYVGRPLYWKLSATIHEIRENKQTVREGISQFVLEAQKSVGWYQDESDLGFDDVQNAGNKVGAAAITSRRILRVVDYSKQRR